MAALLWVLTAACTLRTATPLESQPDPISTDQVVIPTAPEATLTPLLPGSVPSQTPTALPPSQLTVCLGQEPKSLFLYDANTTAARSILSVLYDGPLEDTYLNSQVSILEKSPSLSDGDLVLQPVQVFPGERIFDAWGNANVLAAGVSYRPPGCASLACAQEYAGTQPVEMDQWVIRFRLLPDLRWSDGHPLLADDSQYAYELASALAPLEKPLRVILTAAYQALDATTLEWRGVPGYQSANTLANFYLPLPRHAWGSLPLETLRQAHPAARQPLGWGAYQIEEWTAGEQIVLKKNPFYRKASQGLPHFDKLIFRFPQTGAALELFLAGGCDLVSPDVLAESQLPALLDLQAQGRLALTRQAEAGWEILLLNTDPLDPARPAFFADLRVRQAVAACIDRGTITSDLDGLVEEAVSYLPGAFDDAAQLGFDPQQGAALLEAAGWLDVDGDPLTPRTAQGVLGIPDGTPFTVTYLVGSPADRLQAAEHIRQSLAACGMDAQIEEQPLSAYLSAGPAGPVFGRQFDLAQFAWPAAGEALCSLFLSREIPGPLPESAKGWGGANAAGYANPAFDQACLDARWNLPGQEQLRASQTAQRLLAQEAPFVPLYWRYHWLVSRPGLCGLKSASAESVALWDIVAIYEGEACDLP